MTTEPDQTGEARALIDQLITQTRLYATRDAVKELLAFVNRLRSFAPFNAMLLHIQKPGLTHAATAHDWWQEFGRIPKRHARPLIVLRAMGPVDFVFDIQDTEGRELPAEAFSFPVIGAMSKAILDDFLKRVVAKGIAINWMNAGDSYAGEVAAHPEMSGNIEIARHYTITLNANHSPAQTFVTLCHELGHLYLGHLGADHRLKVPNRTYANPELREVEAETVAYIIGHRNGIKPRSETYLNAFKQDFRLLDLHAVMRAANAIETLIGRPAAKFRARAAETADTGQVRVVQATAGTEPQPVSPTVGGAIRTAMDAELMAIAANMAEICIKTGTRQFRDLVRAMVAICGFPFSTIQPYARTAYNQLRDDLELSGESVEGIDDARAVMAAIKAIRAEEDLRPPKMEAAPAAPSTQSRDTPPTNCNPQESAERGWAGPETGQENNVEPPSGGEDEWPNAEGTRDRDSNRPSSPAFDHETYAKAKPMFIEAARKFGQAGQDILDIMKSVIRAMVERFGVDAAAPVVRSMRPYIKQFAADVRDGVINPWEAPEVDNDGVPDQASDQGRLAPGDEMGSGSDRGGRDGEDSGSNEGDRDEAGDGDQPVGSVGGGSGALKEQLSDACVLSNAGVFGGSIEAASDVGDALFGLGAKARLGIGPSFNEEAYAKAKPLFRAAVLQFAEAGQDIKDMVTALVRGLNSMGIDEEARKNMRPFLRQYVIDLNSGAEKPFADQQEVEKNEGEPDQGSDQGRPAPAAQRGIGKVRDWVAKASSR